MAAILTLTDGTAVAIKENDAHTLARLYEGQRAGEQLERLLTGKTTNGRTIYFTWRHVVKFEDEHQ